VPKRDDHNVCRGPIEAAQVYFTDSSSTPEEYAANITREEGRWAALIKKLGLVVN